MALRFTESLGQAEQRRPAHAPQAYRADVDGLRAVAVLTILGFHLNVPGFGAGFLGVDIFFVISGYVITRGILREREAGRFSLRQFYVRRARRILPPLALVLAATLAGGIAILSPDELRELTASALSTLAFAANFFFHDRTNYFAAAAHQRPLLHMWSLGVEEQFYILFPPLLLLVALQARLRMGRVLWLLGLASFAYLAIAYPISPKNAFFMPMARFWELAVGCGVAEAEAKGYPRPRHAWALTSAGVIGMAAGILLFDDASMSSKVLALPVLSTALVIAFGGSGGGMASRVLAARPLVAIGIISYSIYVVHWPLIVYWRMYTGHSLQPLEKVVVVLLVAVLAALLWALVERPMRSGTSRIADRPALIGITAAMLLVAAVAVVGYTQAEAAWRLNAKAREAVALLAKAVAARPRCERDTSWLPSHTPGSVVCRWNAQAGSTDFAIWGDSHANALAPELSRLLMAPNSGGVVVGLPTCPPLVGVEVRQRKINRGCPAFADAVIAAIARDQPKRIVVGARWATLASDLRSPGDGEPSGQIIDRATGKPISLADAVIRTLDLLRRGGAEVILAGPVPEIEFDVPGTLVRSLRGIGTLPPVSRSAFEDRQRQVLEAFARIEALGWVRVVYPHEALCDAEHCTVAEGTRALYSDDDHLSPFGSARVMPQFSRALEREPRVTGPQP